MTFGRNSQKTRIEFSCFSFRVPVDLLICQLLSLKPDTENNANCDDVSGKYANFESVQLF